VKARLLEQRQKFLIETSRPMMLLLVLDVCAHGADKRWAYGQSRISFLPFKLQAMLTHPAGGIGFDLLDHFRDSLVGLEFEQQMNMIRSAANRDWDDIEVSGNAADIGVEFRCRSSGIKGARSFVEKMQ
jgi:hypothetical protein